MSYTQAAALKQTYYESCVPLVERQKYTLNMKQDKYAYTPVQVPVKPFTTAVMVPLYPASGKRPSGQQT